MIEVVIPDSGPLISLARIDRLDLIDRFRSQILITDAVEIELMDAPADAPDLPVLRDWIGDGRNQLRVVETAYGELLKQNRELLQFVPQEERARFRRRGKAKNAGEESIREFADEVRNTLGTGDSALVLFEDSRVRTMNFGEHVRLMSTWSFAMSLQHLQVITSAAGLFDEIEAAGRTPPRDPFDRRAGHGHEDFEDSYDISRD